MYGEFCGASEADDVSGVFRAAAASTFLSAADDERVIGHAAFHVEETDAFRRVKFVRGEREEIDVGRADVELEFAGRLHGVSVEQRAFAVADGGEFLDGKNHAGLVVRPHRGDDRGVGADGLLEDVEVDRAVGLDGEKGDFVAALLQIRAELHVRGVLDGGGDDVAFAGLRDERAVEGGVVALGAILCVCSP